ncbi:site-specific integrase [Brevibacterium sp. 91QC2O2]|uniref:tyrosine-type recombinase/integrase n=1 Tax=Brevibacterium sp. 91QC2O2 TaxID=2968458 RepID=UPI00211CC5C1|nr:site-specific integrase [Brevibacterium sp. 91QC2O2]MCQ9367319.1 site-specific integrase [Brevibacterium sp. 91QC2O2]
MSRSRFGTVVAPKVKGGKWAGRYTGPDGKKVQRSFATRKSVDLWLAGEETKIDRGEWKSKAQLERERLAAEAEAKTAAYTFGQWLDDYLKYQRAAERLAKKTIATYESSLTLHVKPTFGDMPLAGITRVKVLDWHAALVTSASWSVARKSYIAFQSMMKTAVERQLIDGNPVQVPAATDARTTKDLIVATKGQVAELAGLVPPHLEAMIYMGAYCQMRLGELRALRRKDIDLNAGTVAIVRQVEKIAGEPAEEKAPKAGSRRNITIPANLIPILRRHMEVHSGLSPVYKTIAVREGLVFPSIRNRAAYQGENTLNNAIRKVRDKVDGLDPQFTPHSLRHSGLTWYAEAGATLVELMDRGGHKSAEVAMIYQHATKHRDQSVTAKLNEDAVIGRKATVTPLKPAA